MDAVIDHVLVQMRPVKVDVTHLKTVIEYAKMIGKTRQRVYQLIDEGEIEVIMIGKKKFVVPPIA